MIWHLLCIDPGPLTSGVVILDGDRINLAIAQVLNLNLLDHVVRVEAQQHHRDREG